jgi:autotransporter-associated beta strand protein
MQAKLGLAAAILLGYLSPLRAETWIGPTGDGGQGGSWNAAANWNPASIPNAVGASATFNSNQTATRTINLDTAVKVGSIAITNDTTAMNVIQDGTGGTLEFDAASGNATITAGGTGSAQNRLNATMVFTDTVTINVTNTNQSTTGPFSLLGIISGPGGLVKDGPGWMTFAFVPSTTNTFKDYTGPTIINNGRFRVSASTGSPPRMTSAVTVNPSGQITFATAGTATFGSPLGTLPNINLNGTGLAQFPGAIRGDQGTSNIANPIVLQSDASVNVIGSAVSYTFQAAVSGPGRFELGAQPGDPTNQGTLNLSVPSSYTGGTLVTQGTLVVNAASNLGSGSVMIDGTSAVGTSRAAGRLTLQGASSIANTAYLNITGDEGLDGAVGGFVNIDFGVDEVVGGLMLGGKIIGAGTYGSSASGAAGNATLAGMGLNPDSFFAGGGTITVTPAGVPGDYNGNGSVDAADFVLWKNGGPLQNDFTPGIQASDYDFWRSRFGATTNPGSGAGLDGAAGVPEPSFVSLLVLSLAFIKTHRRR